LTIKTLVLGYGNVDREDDGVAFHVLAHLARRLGRPAPVSIEEGFDLAGEAVELLFVLQLTPELAETLAEFGRVCFVDAHTGAVPEEIQVLPLRPQFQNSPFTHHLTPESLLSFATTLYNKQPEGLLVSVRGYSFGFAQTLSPRTSELAQAAADHIWMWLQDEG
jgi:hydrogenase maturation protease